MSTPLLHGVRLIYLDTNLWNCLLDQDIQSGPLCAELDRALAKLTLSGQVIYELARSFGGKRPQSAGRGQKLFLYVNEYLQRNIPCFHDTSRFLSQEIKRAVGEISKVEILFGPSDYTELRNEVAKVAAGELAPEAEAFIRQREKARCHLREVLNTPTTRPGNIINLARTCSYNEFLIRASPLYKRQVLKEFLRNLLPHQPVRQLTWLSKKLLASDDNRFTQSLVRASLYLGWRRANGQVATRDLPDDYYHVLNAAYSDTYVTAESKQEQYAPLFLSQTQVEIYPGVGPLDKWLVSILS